MLKVIVACLILQISPHWGLNHHGHNRYKHDVQNSHTHCKRSDHNQSTEKPEHDVDPEPELKKEEVTTKQFMEILTTTETLETSQVLEEIAVAKLGTEKPISKWLAFRRCKGKQGEKALIDKPLTNKETDNIATEKSVMTDFAKQQGSEKLHAIKLVEKTAVEKPSLEWSAFRRLNEKVNDQPVTKKIFSSDLPTTTVTKNTSSICRKGKVNEINQLHNSSTQEVIPEKSFPDSANLVPDISVTRQTTDEETINDIETITLVQTPAIEKTATEQTTERTRRLNCKEQVINLNYSTTQQPSMEKILQTNLATGNSSMESSTTADWKIVEKSLITTLTSKLVTKNTETHKSVPIKRAAMEAPFCWDGKNVVPKPVPKDPLYGMRNVNLKTKKNGKMTYKKINGRKSPMWSIKVKGNRNAAYKKVINKKTRYKKPNNKKSRQTKKTKKAIKKEDKIRSARVRALKRKSDKEHD